jgi:hypothetical protein
LKSSLPSGAPKVPNSKAGYNKFVSKQKKIENYNINSVSININKTKPYHFKQFYKQIYKSHSRNYI